MDSANAVVGVASAPDGGLDPGKYQSLDIAQIQILNAAIRVIHQGLGVVSQPIAELDSEALDFVAASECLSELRTLRRRDLEALGRAAKKRRSTGTVRGRHHPLRSGPPRSFSRCLDPGRTVGTDRVDLADQAEFHDYPTTAIE